MGAAFAVNRLLGRLGYQVVRASTLDHVSIPRPVDHVQPIRTIPATNGVACKICGSATVEKFHLPKSKETAKPIPDAPDGCPYYECRACRFLFATHLDGAEHRGIYGDDYWTETEAAWFGHVPHMMRLVSLANELMHRSTSGLEILDFGCGAGGFLQAARNELEMKVWGTDINPPRLGSEWFLSPVDRRFDLVCACEVVEHLPDPLATFRTIRGWLKPGGVFAFQTGEYNPSSCGRDWWYLGPANGHISLYSREALDHLFLTLEGKRRVLWRDYPGVQAWQF